MSTPTETRLREAVKLLRAAAREVVLCAKCDVGFARSFASIDQLKLALAATSDLDQEPMP